jgi:hypothetical protein
MLEFGPCPVIAGFTLTFALQLRKKHEKTSVRVVEECQLAWLFQLRDAFKIIININIAFYFWARDEDLDKCINAKIKSLSKLSTAH